MIFHAKLMQKHISPAGTALPANIFKNPTMHIHSQHPYLLGFDSNLVPKLHILVFSRILERIPNIRNNWEVSPTSQRLSLGIPRIIGKSFRLGLFPEGYSRVYCKYRVHRVFALF